MGERGVRGGDGGRRLGEGELGEEIGGGELEEEIRGGDWGGGDKRGGGDSSLIYHLFSLLYSFPCSVELPPQRRYEPVLPGLLGRWHPSKTQVSPRSDDSGHMY